MRQPFAQVKLYGICNIESFPLLRLLCQEYAVAENQEERAAGKATGKNPNDQRKKDSYRLSQMSFDSAN